MCVEEKRSAGCVVLVVNEEYDGDAKLLVLCSGGRFWLVYMKFQGFFFGERSLDDAARQEDVW